MPASIDPADIVTPARGSSVPAVILAGGRASRMGGGDKPLLRLAGRPVLDYILSGLAPQVGPVALSANGEAARFGAWRLPILPDTWPGQPGPLAGVLAGIVWAAPVATHVLSWPGDTPYPPPDLVARLSAVPTAGVVCAASGGRLHPVVALWPVTLADALTETLRRGEYGVASFARTVGLAVVEWLEQPDPFLNLNTPADLARAQAAAAVWFADGRARP